MSLNLRADSLAVKQGIQALDMVDWAEKFSRPVLPCVGKKKIGVEILE